jgi:hypothetical protein
MASLTGSKFANGSPGGRRSDVPAGEVAEYRCLKC